MSAPDPMKWDVTTEESEGLRDGTFRTQERIVHAVARRRVLAELKAIRDAYPEQTQALHDRIAAIEAEEA